MSPDRAKLVEELLERLAKRFGEPAEPPAPAPAAAAPAPADDCLFHADHVLREFVRSFMMWDAPSTRADTAMDRIGRACVDINEFRVCLLDEMVAIIGPAYPGATERCERLRAALNEVYKREQGLRLGHLTGLPKRDARAYLESLTHTPPFVVARVALLMLGIHAVPVDERLLTQLVNAKVLEPDTTLDAAQSTLERSIRAGDAARACSLLQSWADDGGGIRLAGAKKPSRQPVSSVKKATGERLNRRKSAR